MSIYVQRFGDALRIYHQDGRRMALIPVVSVLPNGTFIAIDDYPRDHPHPTPPRPYDWSHIARGYCPSAGPRWAIYP